MERWFGLLTQRQIKRGAHTSVASLKAAIEEFLNVHNESACDMLASIARFATRALAASDGERESW